MNYSKKISYSLLLTMLVCGGTSLFSKKAMAATITDSRTTVQSNNTHMVYNVHGEKLDVYPTDSSKMSGKVIFRNKTYNYSIKNNNNVYDFYLNGNKVYSLDLSNTQVPYQGANNYSPFINFTYANGKVAFRHDGRNYYYLTTEKTNSETIGKLSDASKEIISILLGLIPGGAGKIVGGILELNTLKDIIFRHDSAPRWYTVKEYCTRGYEYYAWKTYTYSDSKRKHCISVKWTFRKVL